MLLPGRNKLRFAYQFEVCLFAVLRMKEVIPFFPSDNEGLYIVSMEIMKMTETREQIAWLCFAAIRTLREWRGISCLRDLMSICPFPPQDIPALEKSKPVGVPDFQKWLFR